jgi:hypothetical protein
MKIKRPTFLLALINKIEMFAIVEPPIGEIG